LALLPWTYFQSVRKVNAFIIIVYIGYGIGESSDCQGSFSYIINDLPGAGLFLVPVLVIGRIGRNCLLWMKRQFLYVIIHAMGALKKITVILLIGVMVLAASCSKTQSGISDAGWDETDEEYLSQLSDKNAEGDTAKGEIKRVGVSMPTKTSERWINDGMNMQAKLETLGYEVDLQYAGDDIDLQISQIESMIRDGVSCLVISSIDSTKLVNVLEQAKKKGIAVIAYDRLLMDTDAVSYYATFDNKAIGMQIANYIVDKKKLKEASKQGKSYTIEFFMGSPDDNNAVFLYNGVMEVLAPYLENGTLVCRSGRTDFDDTCILRYSGTKARDICNELFREYYPAGDLDIICSSFDGFDYGILSACNKKGLAGDSLPLITGQDAEKTAVKNISQHKQTMTIYKDTRILASKCVTMVQALLEGGEPQINDTVQYDNHVLTVPSYLCNAVVVDEENYEDVLIKGGYYTREQLFGQ